MIRRRARFPGWACWLPALGLMLLGPARGADSWPEFRGPTGQGLSTATNVPIEWNATSNVLWRTRLPGSGWSSPVLSRGRLFLTAAVSGPESVSLRALSLNAADGRVHWDIEVAQPGPGATREQHRKNSLASPTPVISGDRLYVHFGHLGSAALDFSGRIRWRQTNVLYSPVHGNGGSPVLVNDVLVYNADGAEDPFVVALEAATGRLRWKTPRASEARKKFSFSTPLAIDVDGVAQLISAGSGLAAAYDIRDGRELWRVRFGDGYSVVPRPVFAGGLLFLCTGFDRPGILAVNPEGAQGDVTDSNVVWSLNRGAPNTPSLLVVGQEVYFVSDGGIASCAGARTGKVHWSERLEGNFSSSPVSAEGRVYFQNEAGTGFVVRGGTTFELLSRNDLGERTLASYAVADGALYIRSEEHLWRIGTVTDSQ